MNIKLKNIGAKIIYAIMILMGLTFGELFKNYIHNKQAPKKTFAYVPTENFKKIETMNDDITDGGKCFLSTKGVLKSAGINLNIYYPCEWSKYDDNSSIPSLIDRYIHNLSDTLLVGLSLNISTIGKVLTSEDISKIRTKEVLKITTKDQGELIASTPTSISGIAAEEVILRHSKQESCKFYMICYIYDGDKIITLTYLLLSQNSDYAYKIFYNDYLPLFKELADKTEIYSH